MASSIDDRLIQNEDTDAHIHLKSCFVHISGKMGLLHVDMNC